MVKQKQTSIQAIFSLLKSTVILDLLLSTVNKIIPFLFFLCLEMKQKIVQNFTGTNVALKLFFGSSDWDSSGDQNAVDAFGIVLEA